MILRSRRATITVLMTTDTVGGVWSYALELCRALAPHGVHVVLATKGARLTRDQELAVGRLANMTVAASTYRLEWMADPWDDIAAADRWLRDLADEVQPDVVHLNDFAHGSPGWQVPALIVGHSCVLSWHRAVRQREAGTEWDAYRERVTAGLRGGDLVIAPTQALLDELDALYGPLPRRRAIWNGIAGDFAPAGFKQPFVLAAGRWWDEAKNLSALADVGPRLSWPVRVAGLPHPDGADDARPAGIQFLGRLPRTALADQYARAAIFAHPARYEPFGLTPLEAARSGCALVLGDIATLREVWGDSASFVPPDDRRALREAIQELIDDPELRRRFARRAQARSRQFTAERMAEQYLGAYRELIAAKVKSECRNPKFETNQKSKWGKTRDAGEHSIAATSAPFL